MSTNPTISSTGHGRQYSAPPFPVPNRTSSLAEFERRRLHHLASRNALKRKISATENSIGTSSDRFIRLRFEETELEKEEQELVKDELMLYRSSGLISDQEFRVQRREADKWIFSLEDDLWFISEKKKASPKYPSGASPVSGVSGRDSCS